MSWKECERKFVRKVSVDRDKVKSLIETAKAREKFVNSVGLTNENASFVFENYYEIVKELLIALMLNNGMRSKNHQCLFTFFYDKYNYEAEVNLIKQMNYLRNRLEYYGELIEFSYFKENHKKFKEIVKLLFGLVK